MKTDLIQDYFNKKQDDIRIKFTAYFSVEIYVKNNADCKNYSVYLETIGFYEWIGNPQFKVLRIFKIPQGALISDKRLYELKPAVDIIELLINKIK